VARVTLRDPIPTLAGQAPQSEQTVFFRRRDGDWKHTAPIEEVAGQIHLSGDWSSIQVGSFLVASQVREHATSVSP
jgi:hypothetical protein